MTTGNRYAPCAGGETMSWSCMVHEQSAAYAAVYIIHFIGLSWVFVHAVLDALQLVVWSRDLSTETGALSLAFMSTGTRVGAKFHMIMVAVATTVVVLLWSSYVCVRSSRPRSFEYTHPVPQWRDSMEFKRIHGGSHRWHYAHHLRNVWNNVFVVKAKRDARAPGVGGGHRGVERRNGENGVQRVRCARLNIGTHAEHKLCVFL